MKLAQVSTKVESKFACHAALALLTGLLGNALGAAQVDIAGPAGSVSFGTGVTLLPNGNFVVTDPLFDAPGAAVDVGAVYLYSADGVLISTLRGSSTGDRIGYNGVTVLSNGNYVINSSHWKNLTVVDAGAVTWGDGDTGVAGIVSPANSLVGSRTGDGVGAYGAIALSNGHYLVANPGWNNAGAVHAGAVTWGNGNIGISGVVSAANSLVGSHADDYVGGYGVTQLSNGHYVVVSALWDNGGVADAGAVTWGDAAAGVSGEVGAGNSLVGSQAEDKVGIGGVTVLSNGHYVVASSYWDNGGTPNVGAVTWCNGATGISGAVSPGNSLIGAQAGDYVGHFGAFRAVTPLHNGGYVVASPEWNSGSALHAGAVTWSDGVSGMTGVVGPANSLVGSQQDDRVGDYGVTVLSNGNFVVSSPDWRNGAAVGAGAVTWVNGNTGLFGAVSASNSLVGSQSGDAVGGDGFYSRNVITLTNGHYVVRSPRWDDIGKANAGAVTWGNGMSGISGTIHSGNSFVGAQAGDFIGASGLTALTNGNYVFASSGWDNGSIASAGAVTWGNGASGSVGLVGVGNSLVGSQVEDSIGSSGVLALSNGNYVFAGGLWDNGTIVDAGAVAWGNGATGSSGVIGPGNALVGTHAYEYLSNSITVLSNGNYVVPNPHWWNLDTNAISAGAVIWADGSIGLSGTINAGNSLIGTQSDDRVGAGGVTALSDGKYLVSSLQWRNGGVNNAGAITLTDGNGATAGPITPDNSVLGTAPSGGSSMVFAYDALRAQLIVGRPASNIVSLYRSDTTNTLFTNGFE